jgi:hypothetical protein
MTQGMGEGRLENTEILKTSLKSVPVKNEKST